MKLTIEKFEGQVIKNADKIKGGGNGGGKAGSAALGEKGDIIIVSHIK
jgi:hypothetical protein